MTLPAEGQLSRILEAGTPRGAFFLHGDATRLRDDAASRLIDAALDPATRDFNLDRFHGDSVEPQALAAALSMPPMMAEVRVVAVFDAQKLTPTSRKVVQAAVEDLPHSLVVILTATIPKGSRAAFYRVLRKACVSVEWSAPRDAEIPGWLLDRARSTHGFELSRRAAQALASSIGSDLSVLDAELAKLSTVAGEGRLSLERVRDLVPNLRRIDRWTWMDLVASRRYGTALEELDGVLAGESAVGLVAGMVEQHLLVGLAVEGGVGLVRRVLKETGRGYLSWKAPAYARQAKAWSAGEVRRALRALYRADRRLKSGGSDRGSLQELLLRLGHEPARRVA